jgi:hypothetical protein
LVFNQGQKKNAITPISSGCRRKSSCIDNLFSGKKIRVNIVDFCLHMNVECKFLKIFSGYFVEKGDTKGNFFFYPQFVTRRK